MAGQRWLVALVVGLVLMTAGQGLMHWSLLWLAFLTVLVSMFAVGLALTVRDARRAEAFLRLYPASGEKR